MNVRIKANGLENSLMYNLVTTTTPNTVILDVVS